MDRIPASERTRERLKALIEGDGEGSDLRSELVRLAARLIVEEGLEGEATDALGREYYARGAIAGAGYRNGYRTGRLKSAEGVVEYAAPQISDRAVPFRSKIREIIRGRTEEFELQGVLSGPASARLTRSAAGGLRWRAWPDPRDRGMLPALTASALPGPQAPQPAEQGPRGPVAGVQGAHRRLLSGRLAGARPAAARRHGGDLCRGPADGAGLSQGRFRSMHRSSAIPASASTRNPHDQPTRAAVR